MLGEGTVTFLGDIMKTITTTINIEALIDSITDPWGASNPPFILRGNTGAQTMGETYLWTSS